MLVAWQGGSVGAWYVKPGCPTPPTCVQSLTTSPPFASRSLRARARTQYVVPFWSGVPVVTPRWAVPTGLGALVEASGVHAVVAVTKAGPSGDVQLQNPPSASHGASL